MALIVFAVSCSVNGFPRQTSPTHKVLVVGNIWFGTDGLATTTFEVAKLLTEKHFNNTFTSVANIAYSTTGTATVKKSTGMSVSGAKLSTGNYIITFAYDTNEIEYKLTVGADGAVTTIIPDNTIDYNFTQPQAGRLTYGTLAIVDGKNSTLRVTYDNGATVEKSVVVNAITTALQGVLITGINNSAIIIGPVSGNLARGDSFDLVITLPAVNTHIFENGTTTKRISVTVTVAEKPATTDYPLFEAEITIADGDLPTQASYKASLKPNPTVIVGGDVTGAGNLVAGSTLKLTVGNVTNPTSVITYNQNMNPGGLIAEFNKLFSATNALNPKYMIGTANGVVTGAGDTVLTITAGITAKSGFALPADGSLDTFVIELTILPGTPQDKWTR